MVSMPGREGNEGLPPVAFDAARKMVGGGARLMIERGLTAECRELPKAEVDRLVSLGATLMSTDEDRSAELADPDGNEFSVRLA